MKKILLSIALFLLYTPLFSQTLYVPGGTASGIGSSGNGNVGIGINAPIAKFEVVSTNNTMFRLAPSGYPTKTPLDFVFLGYQGPTGAMNAAFRIGYSYSLGVNSGKRLDLLKLKAGSVILATDEDGNSLGKVVIGSETPDVNAMLTVKGNIHAREIKVTATAGGADFVFADDYALPSLQEVEAFVKENKHLPEIPSAAEMEANGLLLAEMNIKLLQKVEELTLYMIDKDQQLKEQEQRLKALEELVPKLAGE